jgi:deoxyribonuclease V
VSGRAARDPLTVRPELAHAWDLEPAEAAELQRRLAGLVRLEPPGREPRLVAGCDVSYDAELGQYFAAALVLCLPGLDEVDRAETSGTTAYPYVPGLLSFREAPVLLGALALLCVRPDVLMLDGQGIAHPRRLGLASHVGVLLDMPSVGCAKSLLVGRSEEPPPERGAWAPLVHRGETVGAALRTRDRKRPVYVSPGHRMDLGSAIRLVLACGAGTKLPEPTRRADRVVGLARRAARAARRPGEEQH